MRRVVVALDEKKHLCSAFRKGVEIDKAREEYSRNGIYLVGQSQVYVDENSAETPVAETDGGGSVGVYATAEDAEEQNTYLAGFDGSILGLNSILWSGRVW